MNSKRRRFFRASDHQPGIQGRIGGCYTVFILISAILFTGLAVSSTAFASSCNVFDPSLYPDYTLTAHDDVYTADSSNLVIADNRVKFIVNAPQLNPQISPGGFLDNDCLTGPKPLPVSSGHVTYFGTQSLILGDVFTMHQSVQPHAGGDGGFTYVIPSTFNVEFQGIQLQGSDYLFYDAQVFSNDPSFPQLLNLTSRARVRVDYDLSNGPFLIQARDQTFSVYNNNTIIDKGSVGDPPLYSQPWGTLTDGVTPSQGYKPPSGIEYGVVREPQTLHGSNGGTLELRPQHPFGSSFGNFLYNVPKNAQGTEQYPYQIYAVEPRSGFTLLSTVGTITFNYDTRDKTKPNPSPTPQPVAGVPGTSSLTRISNAKFCVKGNGSFKSRLQGTRLTVVKFYLDAPKAVLAKKYRVSVKLGTYPNGALQKYSGIRFDPSKPGNLDNRVDLSMATIKTGWHTLYVAVTYKADSNTPSKTYTLKFYRCKS